MTMKRYIAITLLLCLLTGLVACGTPESGITTAPTTTAEPTVPTTVDRTIPLFSFEPDSGELSKNTFDKLILQAIWILDQYDEFCLNNSEICGVFCESNMQTGLKGSVTYGEDLAYIMVRSSEDPDCRYYQVYLILLAMVTEKYSDCLIDRYHDYYLTFDRQPMDAVHVITKYRSLNYTNENDLLDKMFRSIRLGGKFNLALEDFCFRITEPVLNWRIIQQTAYAPKEIYEESMAQLSGQPATGESVRLDPSEYVLTDVTSVPEKQEEIPVPDCTLISYPLDDHKLTNEYMAELILEAEKVLEKHDIFCMENNYETAVYISRVERVAGFTGLKDTIQLCTGPDYWYDHTQMGYFVLTTSDDPEIRYYQRYLVLLAMVSEKYADCAMNLDNVDIYHNRYMLYVSSDYRESECLFIEQFPSKQATGFNLSTEYPNIKLVGVNNFHSAGNLSQCYYIDTLKANSYPVFE